MTSKVGSGSGPPNITSISRIVKEFFHVARHCSLRAPEHHEQPDLSSPVPGGAGAVVLAGQDDQLGLGSRVLLTTPNIRLSYHKISYIYCDLKVLRNEKKGGVKVV